MSNYAVTAALERLLFMLLLKTPVDHIWPELVLALVASERVYDELGADCGVEACIDGRAVHLGTGDFDPGAAAIASARIRECLGAAYSVESFPHHIRTTTSTKPNAVRRIPSRNCPGIRRTAGI